MPHLTAAEYQRLVLRRSLWSQQKAICDAIERKPLVSVKSCHASGKTFVAAGIALWWYHKHPDARVYWLAPTLRQVKMGFDEIALAVKQAQHRFPMVTTAAMRRDEGNFIQGFSAAKSVNAQGPHAPNVLIITDEAPGIQGDVWDALEGIRSGGNVKLLKLGNPVIPGGPFFEDFGRGKQVVECITISAFDTPNLQGTSIEQLLTMPDAELDMVVSPYLVRRRWVKEMHAKWGPSHPSYQSRVLGQFPSQSKFAVFDAEWVTRASRELTEQHWIDVKKWEGIIQVGIDVAGAGDDETACCARIGQLVIAADAWGDADARGPCSLFLTRLKRDYQKARIVVMVDEGGVGYFFGKWLADQQFEVYGTNFSDRPTDPAFLNLKAQIYWVLAEWMKRGIYGVLDLDTQGQLIGVQFKPTSTGQIQIEPKDEAKKRGQSSPDRAEALVLAFAPVVLKHQRLTYQDQSSIAQRAM
jgi:hypothetical protein